MNCIITLEIFILSNIFSKINTNLFTSNTNNSNNILMSTLYGAIKINCTIC